MDSFKDTITYWLTVLGSLLGIFGAIHSLPWLAVAGSLMAAGSLAALIYARKQRLLVESALFTVSGRSIDSLNAANLRRRTNRSLVVQEVDNLAVVDGEDIVISWRCTGYCLAKRETAVEFSLDADTNTPFENLRCFAYDLRRDPNRRHPIRPILLGADGISKKIAVPFLAPLTTEEPFGVLLECRLPGCVKPGIDYYMATLSFNQEHIERYSMRLTFLDDFPRWVRAYECRADGRIKLLKALQPQRKRDGTYEYVDIDTRVTAKSARIYLFLRDASDAKRRTVPDAEAA